MSGLQGIKQSLSLMVNYHYEMRRLERNHVAFVAGNTIVSKAVRSLLDAA